LKEDFLVRQGQFKGAPNLNTDKARNDYIENQVIQEAMFQEALKLGYAEQPDLKRNFKKLVVQKWSSDQLANAQKDFVPSEEQMQEHYNKNLNLYNRDEAAKVAYISIAFGEQKAKAKAIASEIHKDALATVKNANAKEFARLPIKQAAKGVDLAKIAIETNETDYLEKPAFESKFGPNVFDSIKNIENFGQISPLITTDKAFVIMMKTGFRKALNESLADAKPKIIKRLAYEGRSEFYKKLVEELRTKYKIKVFKEHLAELSKGATDKALVKEEGADRAKEEQASLGGKQGANDGGQ
jgi:hypothetical protein